jgi:hypothetical protein
MSSNDAATVRSLLLTRRGKVFVTSTGPRLPEEQVRAVELELADLGYVVSLRLRARLSTCSLDELVGFRAWALRVLAAHRGADRSHEPLFRSFPNGVPTNTLDLWWLKVLAHFLQSDRQPCVFCLRTGTTHVLDPCLHVVCDHCFDGADYSACPVCEHHVDRSSPFFRAVPARVTPAERVVFELLDVGGDVNEEARALFASLCARTQALSPDDRDALVVLLGEYRTQALAWLPPEIPVRENIAIVFGTLFGACHADEVLPHARRHMSTATDVLRFIAVLSGTDGSLARETINVPVPAANVPGGKVYAARKVARFRMARLSRPLRRALFGVLEGLEPERLVEDMLRHRSYWVWAGEFLHPSEHAAKFPRVARAFEIVRGATPEHRGWTSRVEAALGARDVDAAVALLAERPGELARRLDHLLRTATGDATRDYVLATFARAVPALATPMLLTLRSHFPARATRAGVRVYWPKGRVARGVSAPDARAVLPSAVTAPAIDAIERELLRRFAAKPAFDACVLDDALRSIVAPFNERTASRAAISLPRGSRVLVPPSKIVRLFLHWCQPPNGTQTDIDLSVGLYDDAWRPIGVCSYYELQARAPDRTLLAQSAGDLRDAPWPDGATELVDLHCDAALAAGVRYAAMVVTNYAGLPFSELERAFAGIQLRDDPGGAYFDPRTVELKFAVDGANGVFMPLVFDLQAGDLHWLDVQAKGNLALNSVASSNNAITKICPELISYFGSGVRASMLDLGRLHAAARCGRVFVRDGDGFVLYVRRPDEDASAFHSRLVRGEADEPRARPPSPDGAPVLALLHRGNLELPARSASYALFRESVTPSLAASDLLG